jgi:uncharacterized protein
VLGLALAAVVAVASAAPLPPTPDRWVTDPAGFLSPSVRDDLDRRLEAYQGSTGHQVVVWIGDSIGDAALDDWAVRTFAAWKVGRKGIDDGIVVFVLAGDRAIDIEVGYGLEERVPDAIASRIIRETMAPRLRAGDRDGAVTAGVDALLAAIEGRPWTGGEAPPAAGAPSRLEIVLWVLGGIALLILFAVNPRLALVVFSMMHGRGGGGFGGRRGGFSGGGGRSGGGGARGTW